MSYMTSPDLFLLSWSSIAGEFVNGFDIEGVAVNFMNTTFES